ncbi:MAG: Trk system potassium transporter TrkA [Tissierellia bacterium]|nr:Trk system potassium transporter TrkA [Tissierellia bacterium]
MNIVIVGGGKVGELLCTELSTTKNNVLLIEQNADVLEHLMEKADISGIVGNGASYPILMEADVAHCDVFIAVTEMDEINMISAIMANKIGADYTIARVRTPENYQSFSFVEDSLGIHMMINPELEAAKKIFLELEFPFALNVDTFANNLVSLVKVSIDVGSSLGGMDLPSFKKRYSSLIVCIIERNGEVFIPKGDSVLREGDHIHVTGRPADLEKFYSSLGAQHRRVKSCLIIGGGRITHYLLRMLAMTDMDVKVIEQDRQKARDLAVAFPKVAVIHTDGSEKSNLDEEGIHRYEAVVSLTGMDEENIVISMYASKCCVQKIITKINRTAIISYLGDIGLMSIITPKRLIANRITRFVRAIENSMGSNVEALYKLADDRVESLQFRVKERSKVIGRPLRELPIKKNMIIAYIIREGEALFPGGNDKIEAGDKVIVITIKDGLLDIDDILE